MIGTELLGTKEAVATVAVRDLPTAKKFYEDTLGMTLIDPREPEVLTYQSGSAKLIVYRSQYAGTNRATAVTWLVGDDIDDIARTLKSKGVTFEHYDMPGMRLVGDVHVTGKMRTAWFKDPQGNVLGIVNG